MKVVNGNLTVDTTLSAKTTKYVVTGPNEEVDAYVNKIYRNYPSAGYGTLTTYTNLEDGRVTAFVTHYNSCD